MIALWFIALHMLGDYVTQTNWMAANKFYRFQRVYRTMIGEPGHPAENECLNFWKATFARTIHVLIYSIPFGVLGYLTFLNNELIGAACLFAAVFIPHWIIDCRRWASPDPWPPKPIMVDQALHAIHLAFVASIFYPNT